MADKQRKESQLHVDVCKRCNDEKKVNRFGLCRACQEQVEYEYYVIYRVSDMEH